MGKGVQWGRAGRLDGPSGNSYAGGPWRQGAGGARGGGGMGLEAGRRDEPPGNNHDGGPDGGGKGL